MNPLAAAALVFLIFLAVSAWAWWAHRRYVRGARLLGQVVDAITGEPKHNVVLVNPDDLVVLSAHLERQLSWRPDHFEYLGRSLVPDPAVPAGEVRTAPPTRRKAAPGGPPSVYEPLPKAPRR